MVIDESFYRKNYKKVLLPSLLVFSPCGCSPKRLYRMPNFFMRYKLQTKNNQLMNMKNILFLIGALLLLTSCSASKITYFQDYQTAQAIPVATPTDIRIKPNDKISILVNSKDPMLMGLFNLPIIPRQVGSSLSYNNAQGILGYTVNQMGNIEFPVLGAVSVAGKTRQEVSSVIKNMLIEQNLIKDPVVTVEFMNLTLSVLGEVARPGQFRIDRDRITLLDAISMAGDLTIYGMRENVIVQRIENGKLATYEVNLCSANSLYASPAYYLQQNDVVYVSPNGVRARQSTVNGNNVLSTSFWISLASLATSISFLIAK